jgi:hypothetical protein
MTKIVRKASGFYEIGVNTKPVAIKFNLSVVKPNRNGFCDLRYFKRMCQPISKKVSFEAGE